MILLQASYLYTYCLLRGVTFDVLHLRSYELSSTMLPLLEMFLEPLLWNSLKCCRHIFLGGGEVLCLQYPEIFVHLR
jgi:hypothetical protein